MLGIWWEKIFWPLLRGKKVKIECLWVIVRNFREKVILVIGGVVPAVLLSLIRIHILSLAEKHHLVIHIFPNWYAFRYK